ncbi:hypothetical protein POSPLADRAFT_1154215, partial [Postia placenta MAD-698-R-SB12]
GAVTRRQLVEEVLPLFYAEAVEYRAHAGASGSGSIEAGAQLSSSAAAFDLQPARTPGTAHDLALLFVTFCFGALTDVELPPAPHNSEAEQYFQLTRAALNAEPLLERPPSVVTVQTMAVCLRKEVHMFVRYRDDLVPRGMQANGPAPTDRTTQGPDTAGGMGGDLHVQSLETAQQDDALRKTYLGVSHRPPQHPQIPRPARAWAEGDATNASGSDRGEKWPLRLPRRPRGLGVLDGDGGSATPAAADRRGPGNRGGGLCSGACAGGSSMAMAGPRGAIACRCRFGCMQNNQCQNNATLKGLRRNARERVPAAAAARSAVAVAVAIAIAIARADEVILRDVGRRPGLRGKWGARVGKRASRMQTPGSSRVCDTVPGLGKYGAMGRASSCGGGRAMMWLLLVVRWDVHRGDAKAIAVHEALVLGYLDKSYDPTLAPEDQVVEDSGTTRKIAGILERDMWTPSL